MTTLNIQKTVVTTTLPKIYVGNLELSKYTRCRILLPHNNVNFKIIGLNGEQVRPQKLQHSYKSRIDIDIDIDRSGDNGIFSDNNRSVTIDPGSLP